MFNKVKQDFIDKVAHLQAEDKVDRELALLIAYDLFLDRYAFIGGQTEIELVKILKEVRENEKKRSI